MRLLLFCLVRDAIQVIERPLVEVLHWRKGFHENGIGVHPLAAEMAHDISKLVE